MAGNGKTPAGKLRARPGDKNRKGRGGLGPEGVGRFRDTIRTYYREHGRDLPWRHTSDPY